MRRRVYKLCFGLIILGLTVPSSYALQVFAVRGLVTGTDGLPIDGLEVTVTNETKNLTTMGVTGESGKGVYAVVFIDFVNSVADLNDEIQVTVKQEGKVVAEKRHAITEMDLRETGSIIDLQLQEKPILTSVTPNEGVLTGGTAVQLVGENFQKDATVTIGGNQATDVTFVSSTELTVKTPKGSLGAVDVVVTNPDGQSATLTKGFTYIQLAPVIAKIDPTSGPVTGGTVITITGENFQNQATVRVGKNNATAIVFKSSTQLTATVPAGEAGRVTVVVINPDGQESTSSVGFTYTLLAPIITSITPDNDITTGGATVKLIGENFQKGASVTFGGREAIDVAVVSETEISATVPEGSAGIVEVVVTNPDGQSAMIEFTYVEPPQFPAWDVNEDGVTDIFDLVLVGGQFGQSGAGLSGDVNGDEVVDIFDLVTVGSHFGETSAPAAPSRVVANRQTIGDIRPQASTLPQKANASFRLRTALTELERLSITNPKIGFIADLLRQWLIAAGEIPTSTKLLPNYPNPFNPETWIPYQLAQSADVHISIYNIMGQPVRQLEIGHRHAGKYLSRSEAAYWDGRNNAGERVTSGVYFYTLHAGDFTETRKMIILK